jgi:Type I phosphodiesterase / nucleotide pyrophosphatase
MTPNANEVRNPAATGAVAPRTPLRLFVLIDALGWSYLEGRSFLNDILPYRRPLRTVLGFSSGAIPTILTGEWPSQNGHWNLFYYDPQGSPFRWLKYFSFVPDFILNHRVTTKVLKEMGKRLLGLGPLFDCAVRPSLLRWFNWVEKKNIYDKGGIVGRPSIFDRLSEAKIPYHVYTYHHFSDTQILEAARKDMQSSNAGFYFLYLCEMDMFLHMNCREKQTLDAKLDWYESELRKLYAFARKLDPNATLSIFSDHGMTPIVKEHDLMSEVESLNLNMPKDYLAVYDSTMARFWFFSEEAKKAIIQTLAKSPCGRIIPDAELKSLGVWFEDHRFGELVFLLHPGWLLARSDFNGPRWRPVGMHGYHPDDPYSDGVFLSSLDPANEIRTIADVHRCMWDRSV